MFRDALFLAVPISLVSLLTACGQDVSVPTTVRPAMVVQPQPASQSMDSYPGEVRARFEPELAFRIPGKVSKRLVDEGERVKANQPLAELDAQDVRLQLEATRAQVAAAEANLQTVRAERDRYKTLMERQMVSKSQYDNAENLYRAGDARLKQLKAEFTVADNQTRYAVLRASADGVIAKRLVEVGQVVAAGQTVFTLAADGEREVLISLPEQNYGRFKIGEPVSVELWTQRDQRLPGRIRELSPAADPRSRTFAARIAFAAGKVPAELGQSARVFIQPEHTVPLSVPLSALTAERRDLCLARAKRQYAQAHAGAGGGLWTGIGASVERPSTHGLGGRRWRACVA